MPIFRESLSFAARGIRAFLNIEAGITRSNTPAQARRPTWDKEPGGVEPENVVWIFGFGRSGSTWLSRMMRDLKQHTVWSEPLIGLLFGRFYYTESHQVYRENPMFVMGSRKEIWLKSIRSFFLIGASERFPKATTGNGILVVKEPNGSIGAPLLMEALPESRMIFLVRDPRDVTASALESLQKEGWGSERLRLTTTPAVTAEMWAAHYLQYVGNTKQAYDEHGGPKTFVRYEDLRTDPLDTMRRIYSELGIEVDDEELSQVVEKHSWENIPAEKKGPGKFYRKGKAGSWKEDLTPEQAGAVEQICGDLMREFGYL